LANRGPETEMQHLQIATERQEGSHRDKSQQEQSVSQPVYQDIFELNTAYFNKFSKCSPVTLATVNLVISLASVAVC
jgi:hypothetical protein